MGYKLILECSVSSLAQTQQVARKIASFLQPGALVGFKGALGAGKTTLIKELCAALGSIDQVSSPSFVLQHIYRAGDLTIEHWDLYRLTQLPDELYEPVNPNTLRFVEWFEKAEMQNLSADFLVCLAILSESEREISCFKSDSN